MNRADRLRKVIPGAADELVATLAARPVAEVGLIVAALRRGPPGRDRPRQGHASPAEV